MTGSSINLQNFNQTIGRVLDYLCTHCPTPVELSHERLAILAGEEFSRANPTDQLFLKDTLDWLEAEGFIRKKEGCGYILSFKGLEHLGMLPNRLTRD